MVVLFAKGVYEIPPHYVMKCWSKDAKSLDIVYENSTRVNEDNPSLKLKCFSDLCVGCIKLVKKVVHPKTSSRGRPSKRIKNRVEVSQAEKKEKNKCSHCKQPATTSRAVKRERRRRQKVSKPLTLSFSSSLLLLHVEENSELELKVKEMDLKKSGNLVFCGGEQAGRSGVSCIGGATGASCIGGVVGVSSCIGAFLLFLPLLFAGSGRSGVGCIRGVAGTACAALLVLLVLLLLLHYGLVHLQIITY
ncbi:hypothetical protein IFM89_016494 [Coptis chinensis]|uniref:Protein FAR1-RELATED SEQUENCE n=1 Tax=Coptis chinensis TaxID=261450 RepID=A0A835HV92_9MAGN|nr:hypothetical protein IFM89_016494 [Coptis chinensis]